MLFTDLRGILKPVEQCREKSNKMKTEGKGKTPYTEKINTQVPSGLCVHSSFAYGDVPYPLKMYSGKDCVERFIEHIEDEVKRLYATFSQQPMTKLTGVLKREHEAAENVRSVLKSLVLRVER